MIDRLSILSTLRAAMLATAVGSPLAACAQQPGPDRIASTAPIAAGAPDLAGSGGQLDQTYREIYTPGSPWWSQL